MKTLDILANGSVQVEFSKEELEEILSNFTDYHSDNLALKNAIYKDLSRLLEEGR